MLSCNKHKLFVPVTAAMVGIIVGYFAGREHIKHELRQGLDQAMRSFGDSIVAPGSALAAADEVSSPTVSSDEIDGVRRITVTSSNRQFGRSAIVLTTSQARAIGHVLIERTEEARQRLAGRDGSDATWRIDGGGGAAVTYLWKIEHGLTAAIGTGLDIYVLTRDEAAPLGKSLLMAADGGNR